MFITIITPFSIGHSHGSIQPDIFISAALRLEEWLSFCSTVKYFYGSHSLWFFIRLCFYDRTNPSTGNIPYVFCLVSHIPPKLTYLLSFGNVRFSIRSWNNALQALAKITLCKVAFLQLFVKTCCLQTTFSNHNEDSLPNKSYRMPSQLVFVFLPLPLPAHPFHHFIHTRNVRRYLGHAF